MTLSTRRTVVLLGLLAAALWIATPRPFRLSIFVLGLAIAAGLGWLGLAIAERLRPHPAVIVGRVALSLGLGALVGAVLLVTLVYVLVPVEPRLAARLAARAGGPAWMPWALAVESSVLEELVFRLFLLTLLLWLVARAWRGRPDVVKPAWVWTANVVAALAFAAVHLPAWLAVAETTVALVLAVVALNLVAGLVFGVIYWRWGIEAAVAAHFAADVVVQAVGPRLLT